jgi:probable HAF family extracellular repeat protein
MRFSSTPITRLAGLSSALFILFGTTATASAQFIGLGDLPSGVFQSEANYLSRDGSVVVGYGQSEAGTEAFRWTSAAGMVGLGDLPGGEFRSFADGVSADGAVVVGFSSSASGFEAFRWTPAGGMVGLGDLPGGAFSSAARAVSADGSIVVSRSVSTWCSGRRLSSQPRRWHQSRPYWGWKRRRCHPACSGRRQAWGAEKRQRDLRALKDGNLPKILRISCRANSKLIRWPCGRANT